MTQIEYHENYLTVQDGLRVYYREYGQSKPHGTTIICLPGLTRNSRDFAVLGAHLAQKRHVVAMDMRGRGKSEYSSDYTSYSVAVEVSDILHVMSAAAIHKAIFIGTSRGGMQIMFLAGQRAPAIKACILNDIGPELSLSGLNEIIALLDQPARFKKWEEAAAFSQKNHEQKFHDMQASDWLQYAANTYTERNGEIVPDYDPKLLDAFKREVKYAAKNCTNGAYINWKLFSILKSVPFLLIRGANSTLLQSDVSDRMKKTYPHMQYAEIPGRGHAPFLHESPAITAIESFLDGID